MMPISPRSGLKVIPEINSLGGRTRQRLPVTASVLLVLSAFLAGFACLHHAASVQTSGPIPLRAGLPATQRLSATLSQANLGQLKSMYSELTGRMAIPRTDRVLQRLDDFSGTRLSRWHLVNLPAAPDSGLRYHADGPWRAQELKEEIESRFAAGGFCAVPEGAKSFRLVPVSSAAGENEKRAGSPAAARR